MTEARVLRLDRNEVPGRASPAVAAAIRRATEEAHRYPASDCDELCRALAAHHGLDPDMVMVGNGTAEVVLAIGLVHGRERPFVLTTRSWPLYGQVAEAIGAGVRWVPLRGYGVPAGDLARALAGGFGCAFVCNPHNPAGTTLAAGDAETLLGAAAGAGVVAFDEAYADFAGPGYRSAVPLLAAGRDCLVLRTFSKAFGLAGMRVAYVLGPRERIARLRERRPLYSVGGPAQAAAAAALGDAETHRNVVAETRRVRDECAAALCGAGYPCPPSAANFLLVHAGVDSGELVRRLAERHGILVADAAPLGFPEHVRVTVGTDEEMGRFRAGLAEAVGGMRTDGEAA